MKCKVCDSNKTRDYFEVRNSPTLQNVLYESAELARSAHVINAKFLICDNCFLLFNPDFREEIYTSQYNNDQSYSEVYRTHLLSVVQMLKNHLQETDNILEIGCGNGLLLKMLHDDKYKNVKGYDPAHTSNESFVKKEYWKPSSELYEAILLRHTLEGLPNSYELLKDATERINTDGLLYLELTNSRYIIENASTLTLYHECPQYFSEIAIGYFLNKLGFYVHEFRHFLNGEILGVVAKRKLLKNVAKPLVDKILEFENVCIWGISGRSIHFLTNYKLDENYIKFGVDLHPRKQGKHIPYTGQKIISPEECVSKKPDAVIVLNPNYVGEVTSQFPYPVRILTSKELYGI